MTVEFERTEKQFVDAAVESRNASKRIRRQWLPYRIAVSVFVALWAWFCVIVMVGILGLYPAVSNGYAIGAGLLAGVLQLFVLDRRYYRQTVQKQLRVQSKSRKVHPGFGRITVTLVAEGIRSTSPLSESLRRWELLDEALETPSFLILVFPEGIIEIPHSAFPNVEDRVRFTEAVLSGQAVAETAGTDAGAWYRSKDQTDAQQSIRRGE